MKMPYKQDFIAALLAAKEQGIGAMLAFIMAYLRGRYNGGAVTKTLIMTGTELALPCGDS